jgi:hypothetical protein
MGSTSPADVTTSSLPRWKAVTISPHRPASPLRSSTLRPHTTTVVNPRVLSPVWSLYAFAVVFEVVILSRFLRLSIASRVLDICAGKVAPSRTFVLAVMR